MTAGDILFGIMAIVGILIFVVEYLVDLGDRYRAHRLGYDQGYALGLKHGQRRVAEEDAKTRTEIGQAFARRAVEHPSRQAIH